VVAGAPFDLGGELSVQLLGCPALLKRAPDERALGSRGRAGSELLPDVRVLTVDPGAVDLYGTGD
jgi:hypothetical protein